jgi:cytochrome oxidase assembly protein ShyY1
MYRFALRPRWLALLALVLVVVALFGLAGKWQLDRLQQRREHNALVRNGLRAPVRPLTEAALSPYVRVEATGRYDTKRETLLLGRALHDRPGNHVLTHLISGGRAIIVDRGWVPVELDRPPVRQARPPSGRVRVVGMLVPSEKEGPFAPRGKPSGVVARLDVPRLTGRSSARPWTESFYLMLQQQRPTQRDLPRPAGLPELTEGPHLGYAIQWFMFIVIALAAYGAIVRREAKRQLLSSAS